MNINDIPVARQLPKKTCMYCGQQVTRFGKVGMCYKCPNYRKALSLALSTVKCSDVFDYAHASLRDYNKALVLGNYEAACLIMQQTWNDLADKVSDDVVYWALRESK